MSGVDRFNQRADLALAKQGVLTDKELLSIDDLRDAWNAQSDAFNSWDELGIDEIIWFAQQQAIARYALPQPEPESAFTHLAARPLLERVARMADCIDQRTVGEIIAISNQAEAWLSGNPPGQPVAIEPRGCPAPGACSCVEPAAQPEPEVPEGLLARVDHILRLAEIIREVDGNHDKGAAALAEAILSHPGSRWSPAIQPVTVAERPWEREGWCDAEGICWWFHKATPDTNAGWIPATHEDIELVGIEFFSHSLPHHALPIPQPTPTP
jgi:hypothetical protein